jgi:hypothetical protein
LSFFIRVTKNLLFLILVMGGVWPQEKLTAYICGKYNGTIGLLGSTYVV